MNPRRVDRGSGEKDRPLGNPDQKQERGEHEENDQDDGDREAAD